MPSSKPAGALTLASRPLNPRAALPAHSQQPPTPRPLPAPLLLRLSSVPILFSYFFFNFAERTCSTWSTCS